MIINELFSIKNLNSKIYFKKLTLQIENNTMKSIFYYLTIIFGIFALSSCSPNQAGNGDLLYGIDFDPTTIDTGDGSATTKLLEKVSGVDSDGESTTITYTYTDERLTSVRTEVDTDTETALLTYSNDVITHMDITNVESGDTKLTKVDLLYNSGKLIGANGTTESGGAVLYKSTTNVTYVGDKVSKVVTSMNTEDPDNPGQYILSFEVTSDLTYSGNNISVWKLTTTTASTPPIVIPPIVIESELSNYDSNKNPFGTLPLAYNILSTHYNTSNQGMLGLSTNNYRSVKVTTMGFSQPLNMTYTYDAGGYPITMLSSGGDKLNFQYTK